MNYKQTLQFLYSQLPAYHRIGKAAYKSDLGNTLEFDDHLGHPHRNYRTIHIGGTNGKGSVSHMIASILMDSGYKTGLYTSPHLTDFRERIMVDGKMIPESSVMKFVREQSDFIGSLKPSFFEMTVAMAFKYFAEKKVDFAVIEVGLGGRLDSTNIINPVLSLITNIGHDHMDLLGDTIQKVALEKAGIIKKGVPVVISETSRETRDVFEKKAAECGSGIYFADSNYKCVLDDFSFRSHSRKYSVTDLSVRHTIQGEIPLCGDYQEKNIQGVFQACKLLGKDFIIREKNIVEGIRKVVSNTSLRGRWQVINDKPLIICDTGHNLEGLEYTLRQVRLTGKRKIHFIVGFVSDKDISIILPLFPASEEYYFTKASVPRALDEKLLQSKAIESGLSGDCYPDVKKALEAALKKASEEDLIYIGGSTFIVADALICAGGILAHSKSHKQ